MYKDSSLISSSLTDLLHKNEEIELIEPVDKRARMRSVRMYLLIALGIFVILDGYLWTSGMLVKDTLIATILTIFFWNILTLLALGAAYRTYKRMDKAFYALTNMRIIYCTLSQSKEIDSAYFKDIHEVTPDKHMVKIDLNDMGEHGKRYRYVHGVVDPEGFCTKINERLEPFRLGPK
jgi:hypothetical protein